MRNMHDLAVAAICALTPVKRNRVVFSSYYGKAYSDSPKAICDALLRSRADLDLVWLCRDEEAEESLPAGVRAVPCRGLKKIRALASAGVWVDNCRKYEHFKRKNQFYLQTWHGFSLKKLEADAAESLEDDYVQAAKRDSMQCDLFISGSRHMTEIYRTSFWYDGPVLETGTPRNDVFFQDLGSFHDLVCDTFGLSREKKLVLYAPTFRTDRSLDAYDLDIGALLNALEEKQGGDWTLLVRLHPVIAERSGDLFPYDGERVVDATAYPDMQELLCASDLLITDYSSSMFDFALTGRPVLRYAKDVEAYQKDRDFYFSNEQIPFRLARNNNELVKLVSELSFDKGNEKWIEFAWETGLSEDGNASQRCADLILKQIKGER